MWGISNPYKIKEKKLQIRVLGAMWLNSLCLNVPTISNLYGLDHNIAIHKNYYSLFFGQMLFRSQNEEIYLKLEFCTVELGYR